MLTNKLCFKDNKQIKTFYNPKCYPIKAEINISNHYDNIVNQYLTQKNIQVIKIYKKHEYFFPSIEVQIKSINDVFLCEDQTSDLDEQPWVHTINILSYNKPNKFNNILKIIYNPASYPIKIRISLNSDFNNAIKEYFSKKGIEIISHYNAYESFTTYIEVIINNINNVFLNDDSSLDLDEQSWVSEIDVLLCYNSTDINNLIEPEKFPMTAYVQLNGIFSNVIKSYFDEKNGTLIRSHKGYDFFFPILIVKIDSLKYWYKLRKQSWVISVKNEIV